jgi:hypothetical protein
MITCKPNHLYYAVARNQSLLHYVTDFFMTHQNVIFVV